MKAAHIVQIVESAAGGHAVYLNDRRISGRSSKPLGGGKVIKSWAVPDATIREAVSPRSKEDARPLGDTAIEALAARIERKSSFRIGDTELFDLPLLNRMDRDLVLQGLHRLLDSVNQQKQQRSEA